MIPAYRLEDLLSASGRDPSDRLALFALVNLGIVESLAHGRMAAAEAVRSFYHGENCLYVRKNLKDSSADRLMGRGVQLPDLFDALPAEEAQREYLRELASMRSICLDLLERGRRVA